MAIDRFTFRNLSETGGEVSHLSRGALPLFTESDIDSRRFPYKKTAVVFECFPYVCPEPVLVEWSFSYREIVPLIDPRSIPDICH